MKNNDPFDLLYEMAQRFRSQSAGLPARVTIKPHWSGIGFRILNLNFVASMDDISELLPVPGHTKLPGVPDWVKGLANIRGRLLPVIDLCGFIGKKPSGIKIKKRLLVVEKEHIFSGLIVDELVGMQHFAQDLFCEDVVCEDSSVRPYLVGHYMIDEKQWHVFNLKALMNNELFKNVVAA